MSPEFEIKTELSERKKRILKSREYFVEQFGKMPILLRQASVGDRIKRFYLHGPAPSPLRLAGLYYVREGRRGLEEVFGEYIEIAQKYSIPIMIHAYASSLSGDRLSGTPAEGRDVAEDNISQAHRIAEKFPAMKNKVFIGAGLGFSGDAYKPETGLNEEDAYVYHKRLAMILEDKEIDNARNGLTPTLPEAAGAAKALSETTIPYFITFLLQKDGKLLDGIWLNDAIAYIDDVTKDRPPMYYQVTCVHPRNLMQCLDQTPNRTELVRSRFIGLEGNGSILSPYELDNAKEVISSPPDEWADDMIRLHTDYGCRLLGGCCGTLKDHMDALAMRVRRVWEMEAPELLQ